MKMVAVEQSQSGLIGRVPAHNGTFGKYQPEEPLFKVKVPAPPDHRPPTKKRKASKTPRFGKGLHRSARTVDRRDSTVRVHRSPSSVHVPTPAQAFARALAFAGMSRRRARVLVAYVAELGLRKATHAELAAAVDQAVGW